MHESHMFMPVLVRLSRRIILFVRMRMMLVMDTPMHVLVPFGEVRRQTGRHQSSSD